MDSVKLRYFVSAAYSLNFSEVARSSFISQPTISHQIDLLEQELGVKLFLRKGKKLLLTKEGEYFLPMAVNLLESMENAAMSVLQYSTGTEGRLSILLSETSAAIYKECLRVFCRSYPRIIIDTYCAQTHTHLESILKGSCDIYFTFENMIRANPDYSFLRTGTDCLCLVLPEDMEPPEDLSDFSCLRPLPFIGYSSSVTNELTHDVDRIFQARSFIPRTINRFNKLEEMLIPVELGLAFSIVPYSIALTSHRAIRAIPLPDAHAHPSFVIAWKKANHNRAVELFLSAVSDMFRQEAPAEK